MRKINVSLKDTMSGTLERPANKLLTLVFLLRSQPVPQVLLGLKKRGFAHGRWNGFGGKVEINETIPQAAIRQVEPC